MADEYPEESKLLPKEDVIGHGEEVLQKRVGEVLDHAQQSWNVRKTTIAFLKDKLGIPDAQTNLIQAELNDNRKAVADLRQQYAKHNNYFNTISDDEFLARVISEDSNKIHSLGDLDPVLKGRFEHSRAIENRIWDERKAQRDGIDGNSWTEGWLPNFATKGGYSDEELKTLTDEKAAALREVFKKDYATEIDASSYSAVIQAVVEVHKDHPGVRGKAFHVAVTDRLNNDMKAAGKQEETALKESGFNLDDPSQRANLSHAIASMGHTELYVPAEQLTGNNPHVKTLVDKFREDFKGEIELPGSNLAKVLVAVGEVYDDAGGENKGKNHLEPAQFHAAVAARLKSDLSSGKHAEDTPAAPAPGATPASADAPNETPPNYKDARRIQAELADMGMTANLNWSRGRGEDGFDGNVGKNTNADIAKLLNHGDREDHQALTWDDVKAIDEAYKRAKHRDKALSDDEVVQKENSLLKDYQGSKPVERSLPQLPPHARKAPANPPADAAVKWIDWRLNTEIEQINSLQAQVVGDYAKGDLAGGAKDYKSALVAGAMLVKEMELARELKAHPGHTVDEVRADLDRFRKSQEQMSTQALDIAVKGKIDGVLQDKNNRGIG